MRKIKLFIASSLDGYIAKKDGSVDWLPENADSGYGPFYSSIDTVLMGRKTYEQILTFGKYPYKDKTSYVFTRNTNQMSFPEDEINSSVNPSTSEVNSTFSSFFF